MTPLDESKPVAFDAADHPNRPLPKIFVGGPGARLRLWEYLEWVRLYGNFDGWRVSHGWHTWCDWNRADIYREIPEETPYCQAVVMQADLRCDHWPSPNPNVEPCQCVGDLVYKGMCTRCDWEAEHYWDDENRAAEDALDHAWPGWRDLPVLEHPPYADVGGKSAEKDKKRWLDYANRLYPPGWIEQGGPIKTPRKANSTRHVPNRSGWGGYNVGVLWESEERP